MILSSHDFFHEIILAEENENDWSGGIYKTWNGRRVGIGSQHGIPSSSLERCRSRSLSMCVTGHIHVDYLLFFHDVRAHRLCGFVSWTLNVSLSIAVRSRQPGILLYTTLWRTPSKKRRGVELREISPATNYHRPRVIEKISPREKPRRIAAWPG